MHPSSTESSDGSVEDSYLRARTKALKTLGRREKSCQGLGLSLRRSGVSAAIASRVVAELAEIGYVDDLRFCRLFLRDKVRFHPQSHRSLFQLLKREGCDTEIIREAFEVVAEELPEFDEGSLARTVVLKKLRTSGGDRAKILQFLSRRGFTRTVAEEALRAVEEGEEDAGS